MDYEPLSVAGSTANTDTQRITVWTVAIETKYGVETSVHRTEQGALDSLAAWARLYWPKEVAAWGDDAPMTQEQFDALPDDEAIAAYFAAVEQYEWHTIDSVPLLD